MNFLGWLTIVISGTIGLISWGLIWYLIAFMKLGSLELLKEYNAQRTSFPDLANLPFYTVIVGPIFGGLALKVILAIGKKYNLNIKLN